MVDSYVQIFGFLCNIVTNDCQPTSCCENAVCQEKTMGFGCKCQDGFKQVGKDCIGKSGL